MSNFREFSVEDKSKDDILKVTDKIIKEAQDIIVKQTRPKGISEADKKRLQKVVSNLARIGNEAGGRPGDVEGSEGVDSVRDDGEAMDWKQYLWVLCIRVVSRPG